jgi:pimeloyl-ACP methyl ester carboxylesterase
MPHRSSVELHVTRWGAGEDILLIHGSLMFGDPSEDDWAQQRPLADRYQLQMPARRGYGASPNRPPGYGFAEEADDIAQLLGTGAHLVGFSYGGVLVLLVAARRPHLVRSLTVIEPTAYAIARGHPHVEAAVQRMASVLPALPATDPGVFLRGYRRALRDLPAAVSHELTAEERQLLATPSAVRGIAATMQECPPWEADIPLAALAAAPFPTLVVSGGWSPALDAVCDELERHLHAQRAVIRGAGHVVQYTGAPFNDRLEAFLKSGRP